MGQITGQTKLVGLLGNPVSHSLSPIMHNAALTEMGLDWCYIAIPCETKNLKTVVEALRFMNCQGLNITIPHKNDVLKLCKDVAPIAKKIGAVNTLICQEENNWFGTNTDIEGFLSPIKNRSWERKIAIIIGCGGSSRAVVTSLISLKFHQIFIIGREEKKIKDFIIEMKSKVSSKTKLEGILNNDSNLIEYIKSSHLIVNTTPVGMKTSDSETFEIPLGAKIWSHLKSSTILYDLIYTPKITNWLKTGRSYGCEGIDGMEMLINQGAASLRLWSNYNDIPIETMRKAIDAHLSHSN